MPQKLDQKEVVTTLKKRLEHAKSVRVQWEAHVATVQNFFDGKHRQWWNEQGELIEPALQSNEIWRQINLFPGTEDIRQNRLTKNEPRWHVKMSNGFVGSPEDLDAANAYLQYVYRTQNWRDATKAIVGYGDKRGQCPAVVGWDKEKQTPTLKYHDMWDFYPDPTSSHPSGWWWLIVSVPKSLDELQYRQDISQEIRDKIRSEQRYAQSQLKDKMDRARMGGQQPIDSVIYNQFFVRTDDGIYEYQVVGDQVLRDPILHPYKTFDEFIDIYKPRNTDRLYERPPCSDWIDPQKTINKLFSNAESYCDMMLQGRWRRIDKTIAIPVGGHNGQVIDASVGDIEQFDMIPLPPTHFQVMDRAMSYFENIAGVHGESLGRLSGSADSGVSITALQAGDEQNSATAVENLKTFLSRIGQKVLTVASKQMSIPQIVFVEEEPGMSKRIEIIGEEFRTLRDVKSLGIKPYNVIEVEMIVGTAYSDFQQQETITNLIRAGYVPGSNPVMDRLVLTFWRLGGQREVMKLLEDLKDPDRMIAAGENFKMRNGAFISPNASDKHDIHISTHMDELKKLQAIGDMQAMKNIQDHVDEHRQIENAQRTMIRSGMDGNVQQ